MYRPAPSPPPPHPTARRGPTLRRDTVGTFESRLRRSARWRWLGPVLAVAVAAAGAAGWYALQRRAPEPTGQAARAEAMLLAARDDDASLRKAAAQLGEVARTAAQPEAALADRALVELLLADSGPRPAGEPRRLDADAAAMARAREALSDAERAGRAIPEVARARAVAAALDGNRDEVRRQATAARAQLPDDPWAALAVVWVDARSADRAVRERAASALGVFVERRPLLLRARYVLAQCLAAGGRRSEAGTAADAVLARNPAHERAAALKVELSRPPPQAPVATPTRALPPAPVPPPTPTAVEANVPAGEKGASLPRKPVAQPAEPAAHAPSAEDPAEGTAAAPRRGREQPAAPAAADGAAPPASPEPGGDDPAAGSRPSRLRPAVVPPPEPVTGGE